jgi:hypothetical protein
MNGNMNIFFYSKYAPRSVSMLSQLDLEQVYTFCVDSAVARSLVLKDKRWNIKTVPSLLQIDSRGTSVLYEEHELLELLTPKEEKIIKKGGVLTTTLLPETRIQVEDQDTTMFSDTEENSNDENQQLDQELQQHQQVDDEEEPQPDDDKKSGSSSSTISSVAQEMQRQREKDEQIIKQNMNPVAIGTPSIS